MTRQIVTQQAVHEVASALVAEGLEPSILAVQSRIGGGSYTTVKRCLDIWKLERAQADSTDSEIPANVQTKAQEFTRALWVLASKEAQREVQAVKDEARAEVALVRSELVAANSEIARLEEVEATQATTIEQQQARLRDVEIELVRLTEQARRVPVLEQELSQMRVELDTSRKETTDKAVEASRLMGQVDTLNTHMESLMALHREP